MRKVKSKTAYAVVDIEHPVIKVTEIYADKDVSIFETEKLIKVVITEYKKEK